MSIRDNIKRLKEQSDTSAIGNRWTPEEEQQLIDSLGNGQDIDDIAKKHKRTLGGIKSRIRKIAVRMIENDSKSIEEVCASLQITKEDIEYAYVAKVAPKYKSTQGTTHLISIAAAIDGLLEKGIPLNTIKNYIDSLEEKENTTHQQEWKQYYAVARGHNPGIYPNWEEAKAQLVGYNGVKHKKFKTREEAEEYMKAGSVELSKTSIDEIIYATDQNTNLVAFTDGSCINNNSEDLETRLAGYAVFWPNHQDHNKACKIIGTEKKTNNRAELIAFLEAIKVAKDIDPSCKQTLEIYVDSELVIKTHKYIEQWKSNGWRRRDNKPLSNVDILEEIYAHSRDRNIVVRHVEAHTNKNDWASKWNANVDQAAKEAALK